jgi:hypothetical protein
VLVLDLETYKVSYYKIHIIAVTLRLISLNLRYTIDIIDYLDPSQQRHDAQMICHRHIWPQEVVLRADTDEPLLVNARDREPVSGFLLAHFRLPEFVELVLLPVFGVGSLKG